MIWWWVPWFIKALGVSTIVLFFGWLKSLKRRKSEPEQLEPEQPETFWSREYRQMYEDAVRYAEQLYQKR